MTVGLEDQEGAVSTGDRTITNFRFADDISGLAGEEGELAKLVESLDKASTAHDNGDQGREDQADDKQLQRHQHRDQSKRTDA